MKVGWQRKPLGALCRLISGQHIDSKDYNIESRGVGYLTGPSDFGPVNPVISKWTEHPKVTAKSGDILVTVKGSGVGKINLLDQDEIAISRQLMAVRVTGADPRFIHAFLSSTFDHFQSLSTGAAIPGISREQVLGLEVAVPAIPEQQRIVGILDQAFDGIATAKANAEKNLQNARALFESHLQSVFSQHGDGWIKNKLKALTTKIGSGATPRGGGESYQSDGISLIRSLNVHDFGFRYPKLAFLDDAQASDLSNVEVQPGDVLLNITGASVARCCIVPEDVLPARVNQHVSIIRPISDKLDADFLHYVLISKPYKDQLLQTGSEGGSTRQAITKAQIQEFTIEYPPTAAEQKSIAAKLDALLAKTHRLESLYQQKLAALDALKKSLLHQAFLGAL